LINYNLLRIAKSKTKSFIHGKNTEEISNIVLEAYRNKNLKDPVFMMWDGSNFDAH
jgi:hypothetical protein